MHFLNYSLILAKTKIFSKCYTSPFGIEKSPIHNSQKIMNGDLISIVTGHDNI